MLSFTQTPRRPISPLQEFAHSFTANISLRSALAHIGERVGSFGRRPDLDGSSALAEVLKMKGMYSTSSIAVKPYVLELFKVLSSGIKAGEG